MQKLQINPHAKTLFLIFTSLLVAFLLLLKVAFNLSLSWVWVVAPILFFWLASVVYLIVSLVIINRQKKRTKKEMQTIYGDALNS